LEFSNSPDRSDGLIQFYAPRFDDESRSGIVHQDFCSSLRSSDSQVISMFERNDSTDSTLPDDCAIVSGGATSKQTSRRRTRSTSGSNSRNVELVLDPDVLGPEVVRKLADDWFVPIVVERMVNDMLERSKGE
jgi:hypothetical protein